MRGLCAFNVVFVVGVDVVHFVTGLVRCFGVLVPHVHLCLCGCVVVYCCVLFIKLTRFFM